METAVGAIAAFLVLVGLFGLVNWALKKSQSADRRYGGGPYSEGGPPDPGAGHL